MSSVASQSCTNALAASHYADDAVVATVEVVENVNLARDTFRLRFHLPQLAQRIFPGQFFMVRLAGCDDPLLARPFALYDTVLDDAGKPLGVDFVYLVVGKMTARLAACTPGDKLEVWGPLGNGFAPTPTKHLIMVAGGIGQTPFLAVGREVLAGRAYGQPARSRPPVEQATLCYGVRTKELLAGVDDFRACGIDLRISSDDGTVGHHGLVTDLLEQCLTETTGQSRHIVCCGPEVMMERVAEIALAAGVTCEVSLETPMACGIGICFSCVVKVHDGDGWDYKRTCVEGPVFDAERIVW